MSQKPKTCAIFPGIVTSRNDGDIHFIGYRQLVELYKLDPEECFDASDPRNAGKIAVTGVKCYRPRYDGDYYPENWNWLVIN
jgi:hypothetical protein